MNGVRSTFMRKGYLLTALAALLLLAASAGTASAQSVGWNISSGSVMEGSGTGPTASGPPLTVKILRSGTVPDSNNDNNIDATDVTAYYGTITVQGLDATGVSDTITVTGAPGSGSVDQGSGVITWVNNEATMVINADPDTNWKDEKIVLKLESSRAEVSPSPSTLTINVSDRNTQPAIMFTKTSISLTEDSSTMFDVRINTGTSAATAVQAAALSAYASIAIHASGAIVGTACGTKVNNQDPAIAITPNAAVFTGPAQVMGNTVITLAETGQDLAGRAATATPRITVMACPDSANFKDAQVMLSFDPKSLRGANGEIASGGNLAIMTQSDEEVPTLSFSPTDVTINEGESVETVLIAEGKHGSEVMKVKLMVEGDADVSLMRGDKMLEEMDGHVYVDLGTSNSARLTAMSHESRELADGDMAYKAWKLVEGSTDGAMIGEGSWFRVDVVGSTAVPALPLIGQLLLALFLMAGGSRLYRRRQG